MFNKSFMAVLLLAAIHVFGAGQEGFTRYE